MGGSISRAVTALVGIDASLRAAGGYARREVTLKILRLPKVHACGEKGFSNLYATTEGLVTPRPCAS